MEGKYIFHVHTYRCGHAEEVEDEAYVARAIELGAESIWFTDHAPFPEDPFRNRMKYGQLGEYVSSMGKLKKKYAGKIAVHSGLEIEYLPSFKGYYELLRNMDGIEILLLGEHHAETRSGLYTFEREKKSDEWKYLMNGQAEGVMTGFFDAVAHPDRLFKREKKWTDEMMDATLDFLEECKKRQMPLERNMASIREKRQYWEEFWELVPGGHPIITGCDAHHVADLSPCWKDDKL